MSFFDQINQLKQMKELQDQLGKERTVFEKEGVSATVNGKMEVEEIVLNPQLDTARQQQLVQECVNGALKKIQMAAAQQLMQMNGQ